MWITEEITIFNISRERREKDIEVFQEYMRDGWEPFSLKDGPDFRTYYVKKQVDNDCPGCIDQDRMHQGPACLEGQKAKARLKDLQ